MRKRKSKKLKTTISIHIVCEGESEYYYIQSLIKEYKLETPHISYYNLKGQGYKNALTYFMKNACLYSIFIFILDLDRANELKAEQLTLNRLINTIQKENKANNVFLSNPNFETYVAACIGVNRKELEKHGYEKGNTIYNFIKSNQGNHVNSKQFLSGPYYLDKSDPNKIITSNEKNINIEQSSLVNFIEYLENLIKK